MLVLVVEDEVSVRKMERLYLERAGYGVLEANDCQEALRQWQSRQPDLVLLDLSLPDGDGTAVCETIRQNSLVPIIMTTARVEEIDELKGLKGGADGYLKKPFSPEVLLAHVGSVLRRYGQGQLRFGTLSIDPVRQLALDQGRDLHLSALQFRILLALASNPGRVFSRAEILSHLDLDGEVFDRTIDAHIKAIRKKLKHRAYIQTMYGSGYVFRPIVPGETHFYRCDSGATAAGKCCYITTGQSVILGLDSGA
jgi:two-component system response regulator BaeR